MKKTFFAIWIFLSSISFSLCSVEAIQERATLPFYKKSIAVLVNSLWQGEYNFARRLQVAGQNLNWRVELININQMCDLREKTYDLIISLVPDFYIPSAFSKTYLFLSNPSSIYFFKWDGTLNSPHLFHDGYLLVYSPTKNDPNFGTSSAHYLEQWVPTVHYREYQTVDPAHLFHVLCIWGNRSTDPKFLRLFRLLDQAPWMRFYGASFFQRFYPHSYQYSPPYDSESICKVAAKEGISLVLHSSEHNLCGVPSGRIFEAAAASTVIICDENPFVRSYFKDSVFYINTDEDADSIYCQIRHHMEFIQANKEIALQKAKECYEIYKTQFLLEDQLKRLEEFHNQVGNKK